MAPLPLEVVGKHGRPPELGCHNSAADAARCDEDHQAVDWPSRLFEQHRSRRGPAVPEQHSAVAGAAGLVGPGFRLIATAMRSDAVAALFHGDDRDVPVSRLIIVERVGGEWRLPQVVGGSPIRLEPRRPATVEWEPFVDFARIQSGWPGPDGGRPSVAWMAVTGIAAKDVVSVHVGTAQDNVAADVSADGRFLALVRAAWRADPTIEVATMDGKTFEVSP